MNKRQSSCFASLLLLVGGLFIINTATAAPGTLSQEPLQTSSSAPPNLLFHLDTSGSMRHIVPEYDSSSYSFTCDNATSIIAAGTAVDLDFSGSNPRIDVGGTDYQHGNTNSTRCFDNAELYYATLHDNGGSGVDVLYTGHYLNWYFDTSTDGTGNWTDNDYKPGARTRMEVAQTALKDLVATMTNVRVGLTTFDGSSGADLDTAIDDLDASHLSTMNSAIDGTSASGFTPLAESLRDIGRYFANNSSGQCGGSASTNLTIHPGHDTLESDVACSTLLGSGITTAGPTQYFCQQNFAVMLTDGQPTQDRTINSNLQDYDQDCTDADIIAAGGYSDCTAGSPDYDKKDTVTYAGSDDSDYWDDVSQALYEIDLRPDLDDNNGNEVVNNVTTYTIGFADESVRTHPLIQQTADQGGGEFIFAEDANDLRTAFESATKSIIEQSSTSSAVTFNSSTLSSQSAVYQALFNTVRWSGELKSIPLDGFSGAVLTNCTLGSNNCWSAANQLDGQSASSRVILTYNPGQNVGVNFTAPADYTAPSTDEIPQALVDDLCAGPGIPNDCDATTAADTTLKGENQSYITDLVSYLRGDRSNEGTGRNFRTRTHVLGDLVNASPVYVSGPASNWPSQAPFPIIPVTGTDNSYATWSNTSVKNRTTIVYAASNDGMLHGFRTTESSSGAGDAGEEVLAYIPTQAFSDANNAGLHYLADSTYSHRFYNDLTPTIADVYVKHRDDTSGTITSSEEWRTMLIGGQRAGGRSLYMLDITDPTDFNTANAKELVEWEFTHADMGYTFSKPTIAMMNNGKFAAIFGNGYSDETDSSCTAKLFIVYLDGGQDGTWTAGTDYLVIDTGAGTTTDGDCNGLSTPAVVDLNRDRTADRVYAGDLQGNLWAFDLCNYDDTTGVEACTSSGWAIANSSPIMTANDGASPTANPQPITVQPVVSRDPASAGGDDLLIVFGTGQYLTNADKTDTSVQTMYGVRDYDALANGRANNDYGLDPRANADKFIEQDMVEQTCPEPNCTGLVRTIDTPEETMSGPDNGWLIDLPTSGERVVSNPKIRNNILFFNTLIPDNTVCSAGGSGWLMSVNLQNGGIPPKEVFDINNDGVIDVADRVNDDPPVGVKLQAIPAESTFLGDKQYTPDSTGTINVRDVNIGKSQREGRMGWREMLVE